MRWMTPLPIPVRRSSWRREAPQSLRSRNTCCLMDSSSCWKALLLVVPVFVFIISMIWSSEGRRRELPSMSRQQTSSPRGSLTQASFTVQSQCKPNAMMLASIAEVQPEFAKFFGKGTKKMSHRCHREHRYLLSNTDITNIHGYDAG